jgi:hypothetical protein
MDPVIQTLSDKRELDELIYGAIHALDKSDWETYRVFFLEDVEFDFREHGVATEKANDVMRGIDLFIPVVSSVMTGFEAAQHHLTNMVHRLKGDQAHSECYVYAEHFLNNDRGDRSVTVGGSYEIDTVRTEHGWKVSKWKLRASWFRGNPMLYQLAAEAAARKKLQVA